MSRFYGKYRGTVSSNDDKENMGRLLVTVPDVLGDIATTWAEPCLALAGPLGPPMGVYMVPPVGAGVWVEFEKGDQDKPIWVGCRWGSQAQVPSLASAGLPISPSIVMQTAGQNTFVISDMPDMTGGLKLTTNSGASITVNKTGIYIDNGQGASIKLIGQMITIDGNLVDINKGALTIN